MVDFYLVIKSEVTFVWNFEKVAQFVLRLAGLCCRVYFFTIVIS